jgi:trypsin
LLLAAEQDPTNNKLQTHFLQMNPPRSLPLLPAMLSLLSSVTMVKASFDTRLLSNDPETRIVGGTPVILNREDYAAFGYWDVGCGATLIWEDLMLTAAHCHQPEAAPFAYTVYFDSPYLHEGDARTIVDRALHPQYNFNDQIYDFMVIKLDQPMIGKQPVQLAANDGSDDPAPGDRLQVVGFGAAAEGEGSSGLLLEATLDYVSHEACQMSYARMGVGIDQETEFCTGSTEQKDSCQGDSGGPVLDANGVMVGAISWGVGCARNGLYGVNARVSAASDWIQTQICELASSPPATCPPSTASSTSNNNNNAGGSQTPTPDAPNLLDSLLSLLVEITYDGYPNDIAWSLIQEQTGLPVAEERGVDTNVGQVVSKSVTGLQEGSYVFQIIDSFGDGLCGDKGCGSVIIKDSKGQVIFQSDGHFFNVLSLNIQVTA